MDVGHRSIATFQSFLNYLSYELHTLAFMEPSIPLYFNVKCFHRRPFCSVVLLKTVRLKIQRYILQSCFLTTYIKRLKECLCIPGFDFVSPSLQLEAL